MDFLKLFRNWKDLDEHPAETVIFREGQPVDFLYVILSGQIELTLRDVSLGTEDVGGIIGEMAIFQSATRSATATSTSDVKLARINRKQINELMSESTEFSLHVMSVLANRLRAVNGYITDQLGPA
ncbi:MAG: cyclic nucleotide-binding domain-containing protein [Xanthomonadales bacterium]|nr:cyclic nucleotide-binding domain-containing protein [Xanthomonadales bacterium]MDH4019006.1 cyclic nucleotide-binding domain-containing protein [Xanthomonadales bacterium]